MAGAYVIGCTLFAAEFFSGFGAMAMDISLGAIFASVSPQRLRSRVTGAFQAVNYGSRPVGALLGGFRLLQVLGGAGGVGAAAGSGPLQLAGSALYQSPAMGLLGHVVPPA